MHIFRKEPTEPKEPKEPKETGEPNEPKEPKEPKKPNKTKEHKELKEPKRDRKKTKNIKHSGNLPKETIFTIARQMRAKSLAKEFKGTVKEILGTCNAIGCSVDGMKPTDIQEAIDDGEFECPEK